MGAKLYNIAKMSTATTGTGTITLGSASTGYLDFATAGVSNGDVITYVLEDGSAREIGRGTYTSSGTTLSRDTVLKSTNAGAKITLSGSAVVFITAAAEDITNAVVQMVNSQTTANTTTSTIIPHDNTIPQNTEGAQVLSLAITPTNSSNNLYIDVTIMVASSVTNEVIQYALFQDSTANAIAASAQRPAAANSLHTITFRYVMTAGTTSSTTFKVRFGPSVGTTTLTLNGESGAAVYGSVVNSSITISEIRV